MAKLTLYAAYDFNHYQYDAPGSSGYTEWYDVLTTYYDDETHALSTERKENNYTQYCDRLSQVDCQPSPEPQEARALGSQLAAYCVPDEPGEAANRYRVVTYRGAGEIQNQDTPNSDQCGGNPCPGDLSLSAITTPNESAFTPTGSVTATGTSTAGGLTYTLRDAAGKALANSGTPGHFSGLKEAEYELSLTDANGCALNTTVTVSSSVACEVPVKVTTRGDLALIRSLSCEAIEVAWSGGQFQAMPYCGGFLPGLHKALVREVRNRDCVQEVAFTIKTGGRSVCYRYALVIGNCWYLVEEPLEFDKVQRKISRDKKLHGSAGTFTESRVGFTCGEGAEELQAEYARAGISGEARLVELQRSAVAALGYATPYSAQLALNTYDLRPGGLVYASLESAGLPVLFASRFSTPVDLYALAGVDGQPLPAAKDYQATLHSRAVIKTGEARAPTGGFYTSYPFRRGFGVRTPTLVFGFSNITTNDLGKLYSQSTGVSMDRNKYPWFEAEEVLRGVTLTWRLDYTLVLALEAGDFDSVELSIYTERTGEPRKLVWHYNDTSVGGNYASENYYNDAPGGAAEKGVHIGGRLENLDFEIGDELRIYGELDIDRIHGDYAWTYQMELLETSFVRLEGESLLAENETRVLPIYEVAERLSHATLGLPDVLRSDLFGRTDSSPRTYPRTGAGGDTVLASGYAIRGLLGRPFTLSWADLLNGLHPVFCVGIGVKDEEAGEVLRLESVADFYEEALAFVFQNPAKGLSIKAAPDYVYNTIELGYEKWQPEGRVENGLDEPCSVRQWTTPHKRHANAYTLKSKFIGASYLLEAQRRVGLSSNDGPNDTSTFLVCVRRERSEEWQITDCGIYGDGESYESSFVRGYPGGYTPSGTANNYYAPGDTLVISGGPNAGRYTVRNFAAMQLDPYTLLPTGPATVYLSERLPSPTAGGIGLAGLPARFVSERNEAFSKIENLYSPGTAYNLRRTPGRMLYAHAPLVGASLWPLPVESTLYRYATGEGNLNLETTLRTTDPNPYGVPVGKPVREKDDVPAADVSNGHYGLFVPNTISFSHGISEADFAHIVQRRYKYVAVKTSSTEWRTGWILEATHDPRKNQAKFELIERRSAESFDPTAPLTMEYTEQEYNDLENN